MILSDRDIRARIEAGMIGVESPRPYTDQIHAASLDLRLGRFFKVYSSEELTALDPRTLAEATAATELIEVPDDKSFIVEPGAFVLGVTLERIRLPDDLVARVEGRRSLGRLGLVVHSTAGFIDPGFEGTITLEITNLNHLPIALYPGMRVCQLAFELLSSPAEVPYGAKASAKYQGQGLPQESRIGSDPEFQ